jgi:hypothetical protein
LKANQLRPRCGCPGLEQHGGNQGECARGGDPPAATVSSSDSDAAACGE